MFPRAKHGDKIKCVRKKRASVLECGSPLPLWILDLGFRNLGFRNSKIPKFQKPLPLPYPKIFFRNPRIATMSVHSVRDGNALGAIRLRRPVCRW